MLAIKVLYELTGSFHAGDPGVESADRQPEQRTTIVDPLTGLERPVVGLKVPYVAALATGKLPRLLLGQWTMMGKLRAIPDTVEEFTGFSIEWDMIAGTLPGSEPYHADGHRASAQRRAARRDQPYPHAADAHLPRNAGDARMDRQLRPRGSAAAAAARAGHRQRQHRARGGHLVQRQEALVHRGAAADQGAPRRRQARAGPSEGPAQPVPGGDAALARTASVQRRARRHAAATARRAAARSVHRRQLESLGLTGLTLDRSPAALRMDRAAPRQRRWRCSPAAPIRGAACRPKSSASSTWRFPADGRIEPFRFFASRTRRHSTWASLTTISSPAAIRSSACCSDSSRTITACVPPAQRSRAPTCTRPDIAACSPARPLRWRAACRAGASLIASCRRSVRPPYPKDGDGYNGVRLCRLEPAESATARRPRRDRWGITQNDIFLGDHAQDLVAAGAGARARRKRRRELAVASIVNMRRDFGAARRRRLRAVARLVSRRTSGARRHALSELARFVVRRDQRASSARKLYLQTLLAIGLSGLRMALSFDRGAAGASTPSTTRYGPESRRCNVNALWPEAKSRIRSA